MKNNLEKGKKGENIAINFLSKKGYNIKFVNFKTNFGEIDIICKKDNYIIFVEVKYRKSLKYGMPKEAVNIKKQNNIKLVSTEFIQKYNIQNYDFRYDIIEILDTTNIFINHLENAFY